MLSAISFVAVLLKILLAARSWRTKSKDSEPFPATIIILYLHIKEVILQLVSKEHRSNTIVPSHQGRKKATLVGLVKQQPLSSHWSIKIVNLKLRHGNLMCKIIKLS